ncbi:MAG TPA: DUF3108 domain-containing protein [Terricaulis sp.]|nr:DUF3108 domain-containing protein [Terricaulis sp.]
MLQRAFSVLVAGACALFAASAHAETYRLNYNVAVLGVVELGTASFEVTDTPTRYAVRANVRTSGMARMFDQTEINAATSGSVSPQGLAWTRYDLSHAYAGKFRRTRLDRAAGVVSANIEPSYSNMGSPVATADHQRASYDPLSALFALGRQVGQARACRGSVLVYDGRQHYRLAVSGGTEGQFNRGGYRGPALTCQFRYQPLAGFNMTDAERARIPVGEAVFATGQGGFAALLRLSVPTPLGAAVVEIREYQHVRNPNS